MSIQQLPDVTANLIAETPSTLQWVGMEGIAVPISMTLQKVKLPQVAAKADLYVSLAKKQAKGIHMSRLHAIINKLAEQEFNQAAMKSLLLDMVASQSGISDAAKINLTFDLLLEKKALLSTASGYQTYPVKIIAQKNSKGFLYEFELTIPYSSTCPCSASLARQLYANAIKEQFPSSAIDQSELLDWVQSAAGSVATPHSQRSFAYIRFTAGESGWPDLSGMIVELEQVIGTAVQTMVKRSDEQEFARLNAENLMFCEDAARRIKNSLEKMPSINDYWLKVEHQESLHAHNAVVIDQK